jgi:hypothetical protein
MRWLLPLLLACGGAGTDTDSAGSAKIQPWTGGDFDFYTQAMTDGCLGGAFEALFMPEGAATPHPFEYPIYLPDTEELPYTSTVDLREPFVEIPVIIEDAGDGGFRIRGAVMEAVELGAGAYGDCVVTMSVDADLRLIDSEELEGSASIAISDPRGSEERCPIFSSDDCLVELTLTALRH